MFGAAKNDENAFSRAQQKTAFAVPTTAQQSFAIHVDPQPALASSQSAAFLTNTTLQELNPALTSLSRPALTNVFVANRTAEEGKLHAPTTCKFFFTRLDVRLLFLFSICDINCKFSSTFYIFTFLVA